MMNLSYNGALKAATELIGMPNHEAYPSKFIQWAEDICQLLSEIYFIDFDQVTLDLQEKLGLLDDEDEE